MIPKIEPCGTPHWILLGFELALFIYTYCSIFVRHERKQSKVIPLYHKYLTLITESRGEISWTEKIPHYPNLLYRYCKKCKMAWEVHFLARKPYCCLCRIELFSKWSYSCLKFFYKLVRLRLIGLFLLKLQLSPSFCIGITRAFLRLYGNIPVVKDQYWWYSLNMG